MARVTDREGVLGRPVPDDADTPGEVSGRDRRAKGACGLETRGASVLRSILIALSRLYAAALLAMGVAAAFAAGEWNSTPDRVLVAVLAVAGAALIAVGRRVSRRSPVLGATAVAVGAAPLAIGFWWTIVLPVLAVVLVAASFAEAFAGRLRGAAVVRP